MTKNDLALAVVLWFAVGLLALSLFSLTGDDDDE
jgi:hypothetical protein